MLRDYRELKVWQKSYELCLEMCRITKTLPKEDVWLGVADQKGRGFRRVQRCRRLW